VFVIAGLQALALYQKRHNDTISSPQAFYIVMAAYVFVVVIGAPQRRVAVVLSRGRQAGKRKWRWLLEVGRKAGRREFLTGVGSAAGVYWKSRLFYVAVLLVGLPATYFIVVQACWVGAAGQEAGSPAQAVWPQVCDGVGGGVDLLRGCLVLQANLPAASALWSLSVRGSSGR
jgi:hypothetical protein